MGMREKLDAMMERREQVEQELQDLRQARSDATNNTALADLEAALMAELGVIKGQIDQINNYIQHVEAEGSAAH